MTDYQVQSRKETTVSKYNVIMNVESREYYNNPRGPHIATVM